MVPSTRAGEDEMSTDREPIRFRFAARKALQAVDWMLSRHRSLDLHAILKACYFADKEHLNRHGRPIFGASYRAMRYGPVPVEIYELLKGEPLRIREAGVERLPWRLEGYHVRRRSNREPELSALSASDRECLERALARSVAMTFDERTAATHGPDWQKARMGWIDYRDMVDEDNPLRAAIIEELEDPETWRMEL